MANIYKSVYVKTNAIGGCVEVLELKTLPAQRVDELKKEAKETQRQLAEVERKRKEEERELAERLSQKEFVRSIFLAKQQFNEFVESGEMETTEEFESHFKQFALGTIEFDEALAPASFLAILERVR